MSCLLLRLVVGLLRLQDRCAKALARCGAGETRRHDDRYLIDVSQSKPTGLRNSNRWSDLDLAAHNSFSLDNIVFSLPAEHACGTSANAIRSGRINYHRIIPAQQHVSQASGAISCNHAADELV